MNAFDCIKMPAVYGIWIHENKKDYDFKGGKLDDKGWNSFV